MFHLLQLKKNKNIVATTFKFEPEMIYVGTIKNLKLNLFLKL